MPDAAEPVAQVDEHDLDALLGEAEGQHAAGDAAAHDEDALDCCFGHGNS